jgi:phage-related protein
MNDLIYNGQSLNELGFAIKTRPTYSVAKRSFSFKSVLGHSGDVIVDNQRYENVEMSYQINSIPHLVGAGNSFRLVQELIDWLSPFDGEYKILKDSWNEGYFCEAICTNISEVANNLFLGLDTTITFNRKPYWFSDLGNEKIDINSVKKIYTLLNPEIYTSEPLIKIYGKGDISLSYNNNSYYIFSGIDEFIELDCESGNVSKNGISYNKNVNFNYPPVFSKGENTIIFYENNKSSSFEKAEITPRWRRL